MLFVGIPALTLLFTQNVIIQGETYFIGGIERFFAMLLHIGLSIIVLQGVVQKRFVYVLVAIAIHGFNDAMVGILPLYIPKDNLLLVLEVTIAISALAVFMYSVRVKRKGVLQ